MLLFAHTGITLGIFNLFYRVLHPPYRESKKWHIDYRLILLGSMFPDIVDKPLGMLIFANSIANGRVYTHTLLVNLVLVSIGIYLVRRKRPNFLIFSLCSCFHLALDEMWLSPQTLLWPLLGWEFPRRDISHWWENVLQALFSDPRVYVPEAVGVAVLMIFGLILIKRRAVGKFLSRGSIIRSLTTTSSMDQ